MPRKRNYCSPCIIQLRNTRIYVIIITNSLLFYAEARPGEANIVTVGSELVVRSIASRGIQVGMRWVVTYIAEVPVALI
jgi:hypothetical protein